jgi:hypothetical protein
MWNRPVGEGDRKRAGGLEGMPISVSGPELDAFVPQDHALDHTDPEQAGDGEDPPYEKKGSGSGHGSSCRFMPDVDRRLEHQQDGDAVADQRSN